MEPVVTLDRFSGVAGAAPSVCREIEAFCEDNGKRVGAEYPYTHGYVLGEGGFVGFAVPGPDRSPLRLDYNPNKDAGAIDEVRERLSTLRPTRLDYAVDYFGELVSDWMPLRDRVKTMTVRRGGGIVETYQLGMRSSRLQHVVYDKRRDAERKREPVPHGWEGELMRAEARVRFGPGDAIAVPDDAFDKLSLVSRSAVPGLPIENRAMLEYLMAHPEEIGELSKNTRKKYKALMGSECATIAPTPGEVFQGSTEALRAQLFGICDTSARWGRQQGLRVSDGYDSLLSTVHRIGSTLHKI